MISCVTRLSETQNYKIKVQRFLKKRKKKKKVRVKIEKKLVYIKFVLREKQGTNIVTLANKHTRSGKVKILYSGVENL